MSNLFEQFQGADLDRLSDCLKAVRVAGLSTDKHTQAGVNQSSGNVWVWSEDWSGAVACSIGFDVFWVHSCSECGAEHEFETYAELEDYANKYHVASCEECHVEDEA
jgi:hypothetical protein